MLGVLPKPPLHMFNLSLQPGIPPCELKIARVTLLFEGGENYETTDLYLCYHVFQKFWKKLKNN